MFTRALLLACLFLLLTPAIGLGETAPPSESAEKGPPPKKGAAPKAPKAAAPKPIPARTPEEFVRFIYGHYIGPTANEAAFAWSSPPLVNQLFEASLAQAIIKEAQKPEPAALDFDPFINAQDYDIKSYELKTEAKTDARARVVARFDNSGRATVVTYDLVRAGGGWRIRDISWEGRNSLRKMLKLR